MNMSDLRCGTCGEIEPLKWVSVKDSMPNDGDYILMSDGQQIALGWFNQARNEFTQTNTWVDLTSITTHWMPLPSSPGDLK